MLPRPQELTAHLVQLIEIRLLDPLEILLSDDAAATPVTPLRTAVGQRAREWARQLIDGDDQTAMGTVARLISVLHPGDAPFDPPADWWRTPLGQAIACRVGHPAAVSVSFAVAGAMLGITRQGVHDLVTRGKLIRHPEGGVDPRSVRDRLRQQGRHNQDA